MGKASRRKKVVTRAGRPAPRPPIPFRDRPFEGLSHEADLVAMREIIPCASLTAHTSVELGGVEFDVVTLLPDGHPAMVRPDGHIMIGLQTRFHSGDLSHDAGGALLAAIARRAEGSTGLVPFDVRDPAPRLQDLLDDSLTEDMEIRPDFGYWLDPNGEVTPEIARALEQNREDVVPTEQVPGMPGMFWCEMNRNFVRYVTDVEESTLFTALARLQAAGQAQMGEGSRFVGAFRACGLAIPVFELADGASALDVAGDAAVLVRNLDAALDVTDSLTPDERRAREGLVSRQVTIR